MESAIFKRRSTFLIYGLENVVKSEDDGYLTVFRNVFPYDIDIAEFELVDLFPDKRRNIA